jgi:hypothetical protein
MEFRNSFEKVCKPLHAVSISIFREIVTALEGKTVKITTTNLRGVDQLHKEFEFSELSAKLSILSDQRIHRDDRSGVDFLEWEKDF